MLNTLGYSDMAAFIADVVPEDILDAHPPSQAMPEGCSESEALDDLRCIVADNTVRRSLIGLGYHGTATPALIQRHVFENPAWYTAYTPYQPEISQGRLEALLNFQTMITDLTGMDLASASLLAGIAILTLAVKGAVEWRQSRIKANAPDEEPKP